MPHFVQSFSLLLFLITMLCAQSASSDPDEKAIQIIHDSLRANAGPDKNGCAGEPVLLRGSAHEKSSWLDSSGLRISSSQEIFVNPTQSTFYIFQTEFNGSVQRDTVHVNITPDCPPCSVRVGPDIVTPPGKTITLTANTNEHCTRSNCSNRTLPAGYSTKGASILNGTAHYLISLHQTAYIPEETLFNGSIDVNGGTLIVAGKAILKKINFKSGRIIVTGELTAPYFTISDTLENYGTVNVDVDASIVAPGCIHNYGTFSVNGILTLNSRAYNHSLMNIGSDLIQRSNDLFTNECSLIVGNDLHINGTFINKGAAAVTFNTFIRDGSQYITDDGSYITSKNMYIESSIQGGSAGMSSITIQEELYINKSAYIGGRIDICDKNGIEVNVGKMDKNVSTDCRTFIDGIGGVASFVWYDSMGKIVGTGKSVTITPLVTSTYTVTVIDVNGNSVSDKVNIKVE